MKPEKPSKDARSQIGQKGEDLAFELLKKKGYKVLERNFKSPLGEIDIVAREGKTLAFVEVKTRLSSDFGTAKWAVGPRKQRKLSMVALDYLKRHSLSDQAARFDVVAIDLGKGQEKIELFRNAFDLAY
ncbi:MAG: YraN family protein [Desulfobacca sp.]|nr:YraN family protein [Desulfobacca sp.]